MAVPAGALQARGLRAGCAACLRACPRLFCSVAVRAASLAPPLRLPAGLTLVRNRAAQTASMEMTGAPKRGTTGEYADAAARSGAAAAAAPTRCMQRLKALLFILLLGAAAVGAAVAYLTGASC